MNTRQAIILWLFGLIPETASDRSNQEPRVIGNLIPKSRRSNPLRQLTEQVAELILQSRFQNRFHCRGISVMRTRTWPNLANPKNRLVLVLYRVAALLLSGCPISLSLCATNVGLCDEKKSVPNIVIILADDK
jgi:hypothetical protein